MAHDASKMMICKIHWNLVRGPSESFYANLETVSVLVHDV